MELKVIMTKDEYDELVNTSNEPSIILRQTNETLRERIQELEKTVSNDTLPIKANIENKLLFTSHKAFVSFYNKCLLETGKVKGKYSLKQGDEETLNKYILLCTYLDVEPFYLTSKEIKQERIKLGKANLFKPNSSNLLQEV